MGNPAVLPSFSKSLLGHGASLTVKVLGECLIITWIIQIKHEATGVYEGVQMLPKGDAHTATPGALHTQIYSRLYKIQSSLSDFGCMQMSTFTLTHTDRGRNLLYVDSSATPRWKGSVFVFLLIV